MSTALNDIIRTWELDLTAAISEKEILDALAQKVTQLLGREPERFYQIMYRLDIPEKKVVLALNEPDASQLIAKLIFQRQWQKAASRARHRTNPGTDEDLKW